MQSYNVVLIATSSVESCNRLLGFDGAEFSANDEECAE